MSMSELLLRQRPGYALEQGFYRDPAIYEEEVSRIFFRIWILAGHQSQVPDVGDFFVLRLAGESIIIVRSNDDTINALVNVCRHRGSRVCLEDRGNAKRFVCPYHAWTYDLDGRLAGAPQIMEDIDRDKYPLKRAQLVNFHGMLFINFDLDADFSPIAADFEPAILPYDLSHTRIAHRQSYPINANWKLAVENYCECYHCVPAHREFAVAHGNSRPRRKVAALKQEVMARATACGLSDREFDASWDRSEPIGLDRHFDRYPLLKGHVTGSRDGRPVAPLLGSITGYDQGATDFQVGALSYGLLYCDHVVLYRFVPTSVATTDCEVIWLVRESAVEGRDYKLDELTWMWDVTTKADKRIIQDNSRGVMSRFYEPGPYTPMEYYTRQFTEWYLDVLQSRD